MSLSTQILLHNVRSAYNVGSVLRTADCAGVSEVLMTGYTPTPRDRFGRDRSDIAKVALGAEKTVPWRHVEDTREVIQEMKKKDIYVVGIEQSQMSISLYDFASQKSKDIVYIFGNERDGLSEDVLKMCDEVVEIPLYGSKESLNVSVTVGIVLFSKFF